MALITTITLYVIGFAFLSGLLLTATTGSARPVKIYLAILTVVFILVSIAGFAVSSGWLIFLYTQLMVLVLILYFVIVAGAVAGGGIYSLRHKRRRGVLLTAGELANFLPVAEFSHLEGITEERALSRVHNGFYLGGKYGDTWYISKKELTNQD